MHRDNVVPYSAVRTSVFAWPCWLYLPEPQEYRVAMIDTIYFGKFVRQIVLRGDGLQCWQLRGGPQSLRLISALPFQVKLAEISELNPLVRHLLCARVATGTAPWPDRLRESRWVESFSFTCLQSALICAKSAIHILQLPRRSNQRCGKVDFPSASTTLSLIHCPPMLL